VARGLFQTIRIQLSANQPVTPKINLTSEILMGLALLVGTLLARRKYFLAHGICQSTVVLLNLIPIMTFMGVHFHKVVLPALPGGLSDRFYAVAVVHAALGTLAEGLGLYIILSAGLKLLPPALRFSNYKRWMRLELALWWLVIVFGLGVYWIWNVSSTAQTTPEVKTPAQTSSRPPTNSLPAEKTVTVNISNFAFAPKDLEIEAGTTVIWKNTAGRHSVTADDNSFDSPIMAAGEDFKHKFEQAGKAQYFCRIHGAAGGHDMSGTITVK
jgi:plastocyanin/uncharacterized membrane protein YozB (DUF420 family)